MGAFGTLRYPFRLLAPAVLIGLLTWQLAAQSSATNDFVYALIKLVPDKSYQNTGLTVFPILSLPLGGEQATMANAYTAVCRDISFLEANPAAGSVQTETKFAYYHAAIISDVSLESMAWTERWGDYALGAFTKLLHSEFTAFDINGHQQVSGAYVESELGLNASMTLMRDYSFDGLSLGANLKLAYRSIPKEFYQHITRLAGTDQSAIGIMGDLGVLTRFNFLKFDVYREKNFSLGFCIKDLGPPVLDDPLPTTLSAGLAWSPLRFWLISGDFNLPVNLLNPELSASPGFAVGMAFQFVNFVSIKTGFQFKGGNPRIALGADINLPDLSFTVGYTLDLSTQFKIPDHVSLQFRLGFGDNGRQETSNKVDQLYIDSLVASAASDWEKVISLCEEAITLDPGFLPAQEVLKQAKISLNLVKQIESIRVDDKLPE